MQKGIAKGAVVIGSNANLHEEIRVEMQSLRAEMRTEMHTLRMDVRAEMQDFRTEVRSDIRSLEIRLSAVEQRQAKTEGLLEGLRDAIAAHARRDPHGGNDAT